MKKIKLIGFLCGILLLTAFSCENNNHKLPVEFKFRLLDEQGDIRIVFNEGENVIFSFLIVNKTSEDLFFHHTEMNLKDFFRLYKLNSSQGNLDLGKPYDHIFCEMVGGLVVPANGVLKIEIPWIWDENQIYGYIGCPHHSYYRVTNPLIKGNYMTAFSSSFKINSIQTEEKHFKIDFTVE